MKAQRRRKIQQFIAQETIHTQEELAERLRLEGFQVTQATVSRDIKEMGLMKILGQDDEYHYAIPGEAVFVNGLDNLRRRAREVVVSVNDSENLVIIRTTPGNAQALASLIDASRWTDVVGTVGGDDTVLVVVKPKEAVPEVRQRFMDLMG
ncbi:MAG: arginine repressor [Peptococcaceae bacterium]|nr:arginine repressor [Peptococcaceae bacterium]